MTEEQDWKRQWFNDYVSRLRNGVVKPKRDGLWYTCPCCGYPTLPERGGFYVCCLCNWEDDGQDDPHADEVWGCPNSTYSLTRARKNFLQYWIMYNLQNDKRIARRDSDRTLAAKRAMAEAFDAMMDADEAEQARLWDIVRKAKTKLKQELRRKIGVRATDKTDAIVTLVELHLALRIHGE